MAGGGGAGGGEAGADGLAWRFCRNCLKWLYCQEGWFVLHVPRCGADQTRIREKTQQNLARDRAQRKNDKRKGKEAHKKGIASSKGKAENPKRGG